MRERRCRPDAPTASPAGTFMATAVAPAAPTFAPAAPAPAVPALVPAAPPRLSLILPVQAPTNASASGANNNVVADRKLVRSFIRPPALRPSLTVNRARGGGKPFSRTYTQIVTREIAITVDGYAPVVASPRLGRLRNMTLDALDFSGRHVVVTGGAGALGRAVVEAFVGAGAVCHVPHRGAAPTDFAPHERIRLVGGVELTDEARVARFYADLPSLWASVQVAGGFAAAPLLSTSLADLRAQLDQNLVSAFLCCREAARRMDASGGRLG